MKNNILSKEDVVHLSDLANLSLTPEEISKYTEQFTETLDYVENLKELNTDDISDNSYIFEVANVTHKDEFNTKRILSQNDALKNSANKTDKYFIVKKIM